MDCLQAQQLISDALDKVPVDQTELAGAKEHCRQCEDCRVFVRALLAVHRSAIPNPPDDLPDRVMAAIRAEAAIAKPSEKQEPAGSPAVESAQPPGGAPARSWSELYRRALDPRHRRELVVWGTAATMLLVAAGFGAVVGVRAILIPPRVTEMEFVGASEDASVPQAGPEEMRSGDESGQTSGADSQAPNLIAVGSTVYRLVGPAPAVDTDSLEQVGTTRTDLGGGSSAESFDVLGRDDAASIYIESDEGVLSFTRVTRTFGGRLYVLQSGPLETFGSWPTLPTGLQTPTSPDGSPTFEKEGVDDVGIPVYRRTGGDAEDGVAVGPNPPFPDPLAGAPVWTWWAPDSR